MTQPYEPGLGHYRCWYKKADKGKAAKATIVYAETHALASVEAAKAMWGDDNEEMMPLYIWVSDNGYIKKFVVSLAEPEQNYAAREINSFRKKPRSLFKKNEHPS